ncbi:MAG: leucine-rich repeat domain-containing protein [Verrucomicrobia bacterium]|nr:leucine-rich repeat domain-containing protein [Verrucomicrobiota bacterium]
MGNRRLHFGETIAFAKRAPRRSDSPRPRQPTKSAPPERVQLSRLADLGFHWDRHARRATVEPHSRKKVDTVTLSEAVSVLRILDCKELDLSSCHSLQNVDGLKELRALTSLYLRGCPKISAGDIQALKVALTKAKIESSNY